MKSYLVSCHRDLQAEGSISGGRERSSAARPLLLLLAGSSLLAHRGGEGQRLPGLGPAGQNGGTHSLPPSQNGGQESSRPLLRLLIVTRAKVGLRGTGGLGQRLARGDRAKGSSFPLFNPSVFFLFFFLKGAMLWQPFCTRPGWNGKWREPNPSGRFCHLTCMS